ncbi:hypothetical protein JTE90_010407 [Oedothorax gibbosus]|uniref:Craniofacial development protein 1 n=1 Tax=Oedothorax gibbosus TaxID=931172 RepID=A0AAV6W517_9ARAC|nr:hypothetical protein JTE90_010407 [Oedothorax gibbosus]
MSSIFDVGVSSDSEDDADYVPAGEVAHSESSSEGNCSEEDEPKPKRAKTKKSSVKPVELESEIEVEAEKPSYDEKARADDIWKSFLTDVERNSPTKSSTQTCADSGLTDSPLASSPVLQSKSEVPAEPVPNPSVEVFEFAGEIVTVQKSSTIDSGQDPNAGTVESPKPQVGASAAKKRGGIGSVLGTLMNKKQKMTTLQKTLYDWKTFKKDEGIEEDLEKYNKGRGGFIERQKFLQRSDVRSYEAEKTVRQSRKNK